MSAVRWSHPAGLRPGSVRPMTSNQELQVARELAAKASEVAGKLKPGNYDAVSALALTSIAHSLSVLASRTTSDPDRPS